MPHSSEKAPNITTESKTPDRPEAGGQPPGQGHRDGLGHRVGRDDPGALAGAGAERAGHVRHGDVGDRHVEHGEEVGQRQDDGRQPEHPALECRQLLGFRGSVRHDRSLGVSAGIASSCRGVRGSRHEVLRLAAQIDLGRHRQSDPQRMGCQFGGSRRTRTGSRCTTLIQLPVAFCAGIRANAAPVPPLKPSTTPWKTTLWP